MAGIFCRSSTVESTLTHAWTRCRCRRPLTRRWAPGRWRRRWLRGGACRGSPSAGPISSGPWLGCLKRERVCVRSFHFFLLGVDFLDEVKTVLGLKKKVHKDGWSVWKERVCNQSFQFFLGGSFVFFCKVKTVLGLKKKLQKDGWSVWKEKERECVTKVFIFSLGEFCLFLRKKRRFKDQTHNSPLAPESVLAHGVGLRTSMRPVPAQATTRRTSPTVVLVWLSIDSRPLT